MSAAPRAVPPSVNGWNPDYLDAQYQRFRADPASVPADLRAFFQGFDLASAGAGRASSATTADGLSFQFDRAVEDLIYSFREHGHLASRLDPFGRVGERPAELTLAFHGLSDADLDREVRPRSMNVAGGTTLRQLLARLERTYCGTVGAEFMHVQNEQERAWLIEVFERHEGRVPLTPPQRTEILEQLTRSETFEKFLGKRYPGEKRFSLEGSESLIPLLDEVIDRAAELGVEEIVLGMAHRGRLNVLNNILGKTYEQIFTEFEDSWGSGPEDNGGDVKYHRGYSGKRVCRNGTTVHLALSSNPSHLESVNPVVQGRCRAKQRLRADLERRRVIPVLVHGDAAFPAQGMVAEVLNLSQLEGYTTGGTVHVVVNNLIGFTTSPEDARSSRYCTDIAKMVEAPVFHVNGEDPEAVVAVARFAVEYRQQFRRDVVIDLYCFRRYGHNEQDEPSFTQPILAALIRNKGSVLKVYAERLLAEGVITEAAMESVRARLDEALERAQRAARERPNAPNIEPGSDRWRGITGAYSHAPCETKITRAVLEEVCAALGRTPEGFRVNPKLTALLKARAELPTSGALTHADAELIAFGSLLLEGTAVRLSGQDSRRGTFSQRHAVLRDVETGEPYTPLNFMRDLGVPGTDRAPGTPGPDGRARQARFCVYDSPLSEQSVLGFDYGYSLADPNMLVLWEAQFGDFSNGAQVIIDQYLASSEVKWQRWSGLVMLLPHGYEGAGPEHSSARIERFLSLCADDNLQVVYPSTAPQMFHLLRRQVKRAFRKPLIVMTPKSMLRVPTGHVDDLLNGRFHEVLDDPKFASAGSEDRRRVSRVLLCSGKIYHELAQRRDELKRDDIAILRVEQLYPFHAELFSAINAMYPAAAERVWVQEEPRNKGAYQYFADVYRVTLRLGEVTYIGRDASASSAVGSKIVHKHQQESILTRAVGPKPDSASAKPDRAPAGKGAGKQPAKT